MSAHRAAWRAFHGDIPEGMFVCHKCDTRRCVNPAHLFLGTALDNTRDMLAKGREDFPAGQRHSHAKLDDQTVLAIRGCGLHSTDVAAQFGIAECTASQILNRKRWAHLPPAASDRPQPSKRIRRGESHSSAKLNEAQARAIFSDPRRPGVVASEYGVSASLVRLIRKGEAWAHATGAKAA